MEKRIVIVRTDEGVEIFDGDQFTFATFGETDAFFVILETTQDGNERPVKMIPTTWIKEVNLSYGDE